jgi:hypothetical protein
MGFDQGQYFTLNAHQSPIKDVELQGYLGNKPLSLRAILAIDVFAAAGVTISECAVIGVRNSVFNDKLLSGCMLAIRVCQSKDVSWAKKVSQILLYW